MSTQHLFHTIVILAGVLADILSTVLLNHIISCSKRHRFLKLAYIKTQNKTSCGSSTHFSVCVCVCFLPCLGFPGRTQSTLSLRCHTWNFKYVSILPLLLCHIPKSGAKHIHTCIYTHSHTEAHTH